MMQSSVHAWLHNNTCVLDLMSTMHVMQSITHRHCGAAIAHWRACQSLLPYASAAARTASPVR